MKRSDTGDCVGFHCSVRLPTVMLPSVTSLEYLCGALSLSPAPDPLFGCFALALTLGRCVGRRTRASRCPCPRQESLVTRSRPCARPRQPQHPRCLHHPGGAPKRSAHCERAPRLCTKSRQSATPPRVSVHRTQSSLMHGTCPPSHRRQLEYGHVSRPKRRGEAARRCGTRLDLSLSARVGGVEFVPAVE